jgi:spore germination cell wall hydrolase CwlJ-like protein
VAWAEARGEGEVGKTAVAHVILNRAKASGRSVCEVTHQRGQFQRGLPPKSFSVTITEDDPTGGATYFRTIHSGTWKHLKRYKTIGNHKFYGL